jgi:hypothetical protein
MATVTNDGLLAVARLLGVQTLPTVLSVRPEHETAGAWDAAAHAAAIELAAAGLVDEAGNVDDELSAALFILANPDRELVARICGPDRITRVCLARRGLFHAVAVRTGDRYDVRTYWADEDPAVLSRPIIAALGRAEPARIVTFSAPTPELRRYLDEATADSTGAGFARVARNIGNLDERAAFDFGKAMAHCTTHTEVVAYCHHEGVTMRSPVALAVYDTEHGRITGGSRVTCDGQAWSSFAPGSDIRVVDAISELIAALPGGRWMP